jgi:hypothetical protein
MQLISVPGGQPGSMSRTQVWSHSDIVESAGATGEKLNEDGIEHTPVLTVSGRVSPARQSRCAALLYVFSQAGSVPVLWLIQIFVEVWRNSRRRSPNPHTACTPPVFSQVYVGPTM